MTTFKTVLLLGAALACQVSATCTCTPEQKELRSAKFLGGGTLATFLGGEPERCDWCWRIFEYKKLARSERQHPIRARVMQEFSGGKHAGKVNALVSRAEQLYFLKGKAGALNDVTQKLKGTFPRATPALDFRTFSRKNRLTEKRKFTKIAGEILQLIEDVVTGKLRTLTFNLNHDSLPLGMSADELSRKVVIAVQENTQAAMLGVQNEWLVTHVNVAVSAKPAKDILAARAAGKRAVRVTFNTLGGTLATVKFDLRYWLVSDDPSTRARQMKELEKLMPQEYDEVKHILALEPQAKTYPTVLRMSADELTGKKVIVVQKNSQAAKLGVQNGWLVTHVNGIVVDADTISQILAAQAAGNLTISITFNTTTVPK